VKKAPEDFHLDLKLQGGYGSQENYYSPYLGSASFSDRYLDNKLGVVLTADIQRANRSSDAQDVTYLLGGEKADGSAIIDVEDLNLADVKEIRKRYGSSLSLDYDLGNGNIMLNTFWSKTDRDQVRRRKRFQLTNARTQYELMTSTIHLQLFSINLQGNHNIGVFQIDWGGSYSESDQNTPEEFNNLFQELSSLKSSLITDQGPELIPLGVKDDLSNTTFKQSILTSRKVLEHNYTVQLNSKINFDWGKEIAGDVKFGGKMRWKMRTRDDTQYWTAAFSIDSIGVIAKTNPNALYRNFALTPGGNILMNNFLSASDEVGTFLNGKYTFGPSLNVGTMNDFLNNMRYAKMRSGASLYILNPQIDLEDYNATENVSAGYVMMEATMFRDLLIIPGIRIEHTYNNFKSITGTPVTGEDATPNLANAKDTTGVRTYDDFLPMIQMKYKIADWIDVRAAVTKTISRPNYYDLVPWEASSILDHTLDKGNPDLNRTQIWNYDFYVSTYNQYGLFTVGSFYKKLWDVSYTRQSRIQDGGKYNGYTLTQPVNAKSPSTVYGAEFDFQANLTLLPSPFDGIVFSANLALMKSTTYFPLFEVGHMTVYPYSAIVIDTVREGPLPNQANYTGNVSIGYERGGFSGRLSLSTQGKSLSLVGERAELDGYTSEYVRWDLSLQQKIGYGLSVYTNVNNLTNVADKSYLGIERFSTSEEYYGWTLDVGIKYKF
jgi:TonB-dependent receptor